VGVLLGGLVVVGGVRGHACAVAIMCAPLSFGVGRLSSTLAHRYRAGPALLHSMSIEAAPVWWMMKSAIVGEVCRQTRLRPQLHS